LAKFIKQYGEEKGKKYFYSWLNKHNLDPDKPYKNQDQLYESICTSGMCESFRWVDKPLMQFWKQDKEATYWKVVALTANVSMNQNDYGDDIDEFQNTASSLSWRPLDWNHDHGKMLPFPDNRTELARFEDNAVETVIRIDNNQRHYENNKLVNDMIKNGDILHVSIEGTPRGAERTSKGVAPRNWHFTGLALLEKDVTLPGDPLTYIEPLLFNESMGRSLVESLMEKGREQLDMTETEENKTIEEKPLANLTEDYTGIQGMDQCGQCKFFMDLKNSTVEIPHVTGETDSSVITRTSGGFGAGIGVCQVATQLTGQTKYVRKNDPVCTDGRPREAPTDADRIKEEKTLNEIELDAVKADYERRIAYLETQIIEETQKTNSERESKLKTMIDVSTQGDTLKEKERVIANITSDNARLKEERVKHREEIDNLREQMSSLNIGITERDKDIKHYKDRYDSYERTHKELSNETLMLKEQLTSTLNKRDEEATKRAEANQRALNAERERARIAEENALIIEKLAKLQQEIYDSSRIRADTAKDKIKDSKVIEELRFERDKLIESVRELKQKLSKHPNRIKVKG